MATVDLAALCQHLVDLAEDEVRALRNDDLADFQSTAAERERWYGALLAALDSAAPGPEDRSALEALWEADRTLEQAIAQALAETRAALMDSRKGRSALDGYAAETEDQPSKFLDKAL